MKLCFCGPESECRTILQLINQIPRYQNWVGTWEGCTDYDSFVRSLTSTEYDAVIITENNAIGMEGVIAARNVHPQIPVVWFSNDEGFGSQAYRLNTDFFHSKPITAPILEMALARLPKKVS